MAENNRDRKSYAVIVYTDGEEFTHPQVVRSEDLDELRRKADEATGGNFDLAVIHAFAFGGRTQAEAKTVPICEECGSSDVKCDALASWNSDDKRFEVENTFDTWQCFGACNSEETSVEWVDAANFEEPEFKFGCPDCGEDYGDDKDSKGTVCRACKRGIVDRKESE